VKERSAKEMKEAEVKLAQELKELEKLKAK
jgi:hypothetical protein